MSRLLSILVAAAALAGCATSTPYRPRGQDGLSRVGYAEQALEADRLRVSFAGNTTTTRETVELGMLFRAAELTLARGYDWFEFVDRRTDVTSRAIGAGAMRGYGWPGFHGRWGGHHGFAGWGPGPIGAFDPVFDLEAREWFTAVGEIVMRRGAKPEERLEAFDARAIVANVGPRFRAPDATP
ncbi:MAG: hypothetical protein AB1942_00160 [Pseudomonadota bacterium]